MEKFTFEIEAKLDKATKGVEDLTQSVEDLKKAQSEQVDALNKQINDLTKTQKKTGGAVKKLAKGFKGVGLAMKAAGIGLVLMLFNKLSEAMMRNQTFADAIEVVFTAIGIVFKQVTDAIMGAVERVNEATGGFDALKSVVGGAVTIAMNSLLLVLQGLQMGFVALRIAYEKVFGSDEGVKQAQADMDVLKEKAAETTSRIVEAGKDVATNIVEAVGEVAQLTTSVVESASTAIQDINAEAIMEDAKKVVALKKNYGLLESQSQRLIEQYDLEAESQRQIRDDVSLSIEERIKANEELGKILKEQSEEEKKQIGIRQDALREQIRLEGESHELTQQLYDLETELLAIDAKVAGFKSEQLTNEVGLKQELRDLDNTALQALNEREIAEAQFTADQELNGLARVEAKRAALQLEEDLELKRLQQIINNSAEGTQARADAEAEYLSKKQEFSQASINLDKEEAEAKKANLAAVGNALGNLSSVLGEETAAGKATAIAATTISTYQSAQDSYKSLAGIPVIGPALGFAAAAAAIVGGLAQIKKITATKIPNTPDKGTAPPPTGSTPATAQAPSFNIVGASQTSQIADVIGSANQEPVKAYVVSNDVTSAQSMDRNIVEEASI
jgi:hypothetical protein